MMKILSRHRKWNAVRKMQKNVTVYVAILKKNRYSENVSNVSGVHVKSKDRIVKYFVLQTCAGDYIYKLL